MALRLLRPLLLALDNNVTVGAWAEAQFGMRLDIILERELLVLLPQIWACQMPKYKVFRGWNNIVHFYRVLTLCQIFARN